ncbi:ABC-type multidrug transport system fused ATPase/permease subunit [Rhabdobacter roseus]|uniref:ABC-type multidrug transport system fused ATPase/permease subunit n=1 Tax=Rhabdobacter roseus TaxID=1655419 RepID=A0A840TID1_9BACT|nr:hypothetical protein [Rhabdobacter roseus]MBB5282705.1 ABC-type multidrug transport system fused ATPase/permease subunit [Rhabdobacter roseus]
MMTNRIEISKFDIKASQVMTWAFTLLFLIVSAIIIFSSFTLNGLFVFVIMVLLTALINYWSSKIWNIWHENNFLYIQNIYTTRKIFINKFEKIEMTSVLNNLYTLYLNDGKKYQFRIKPTDNLMLFFKTDPQFYAKEMTKEINELKRNAGVELKHERESQVMILESKLSLGGIKYIQLLILLICIFLIIINSIFLWINPSNHIKALFVLTLVFIATLNYFYSKIYDVCLNKNRIVFKNFYRSKEKEINSFKLLKKSNYIPFLYIVVFNDSQAYFIGNMKLISKEFTGGVVEDLEAVTIQLKGSL